MLDMSQAELLEAINSLGDGVHQLKDIENQVVKNRHDKQKKTRKRSKKQYTENRIKFPSDYGRGEVKLKGKLP